MYFIYEEQTKAIKNLLMCVENGVKGMMSDSLTRIQACLKRRAWNDVMVGDCFLGLQHIIYSLKCVFDYISIPRIYTSVNYKLSRFLIFAATCFGDCNTD